VVWRGLFKAKAVNEVDAECTPACRRSGGPEPAASGCPSYASFVGGKIR
jgi:hypothetical protein